MSRRAAHINAALLLAAVLSIGFGTICLAKSQPGNATVLDRGSQLVKRNCGMCHATGRSDSSAFPKAPAFRDLHKRYPIASLGEALAEGILTGHPSMPEFRFAPTQVAEILAYLESIQARRHTSQNVVVPTVRSAGQPGPPRVPGRSGVARPPFHGKITSSWQPT